MGLIKINSKLPNLKTMIYLEALETRTPLPYRTKLNKFGLMCNTTKKLSITKSVLFVNYRSIVPLLQSVEKLIGTIYTWPRLIPKYLFSEPANHLSTLAIINFLYGNGVSCEMAVQLFRAYNENATDELVEHLLLL